MDRGARYIPLWAKSNLTQRAMSQQGWVPWSGAWHKPNKQKWLCHRAWITSGNSWPGPLMTPDATCGRGWQGWSQIWQRSLCSSQFISRESQEHVSNEPINAPTRKKKCQLNAPHGPRGHGWDRFRTALSRSERFTCISLLPPCLNLEEARKPPLVCQEGSWGVGGVLLHLKWPQPRLVEVGDTVTGGVGVFFDALSHAAVLGEKMNLSLQ